MAFCFEQFESKVDLTISIAATDFEIHVSSIDVPVCRVLSVSTLFLEIPDHFRGGGVFSGGSTVLGKTGAGSKSNYDFVVIDPGHGGKDGGSKWYGVTEKDLALDLAKRVKTALEAKGIEVALTRSTDKYVRADRPRRGGG